MHKMPKYAKRLLLVPLSPAVLLLLALRILSSDRSMANTVIGLAFGSVFFILLWTTALVESDPEKLRMVKCGRAYFGVSDMGLVLFPGIYVMSHLYGKDVAVRWASLPNGN